MIHIPGESPVLSQLREQTQGLLSDALTDDNGLMSDLHEVGYLKTPVEGYLGSMAVMLGERAEIFADSMPGPRGLTSNGGPSFNYESVHSQMIRRGDMLNSRLPYGSFIKMCTGLVVSVGEGMHYSDKSSLGLRRQWECAVDDIESVLSDAFGELGLAGEIDARELVSAAYGQTVDLASPTRALRVAAKWKAKTLTPPYDPDSGDYMETMLSEPQALEGLAMELDDIRTRQPRRDIDIVRLAQKPKNA